MDNYEVYIALYDGCHLADKIDNLEMGCILGLHRGDDKFV